MNNKSYNGKIHLYIFNISNLRPKLLRPSSGNWQFWRNCQLASLQLIWRQSSILSLPRRQFHWPELKPHPWSRFTTTGSNRLFFVSRVPPWFFFDGRSILCTASLLPPNWNLVGMLMRAPKHLTWTIVHGIHLSGILIFSNESSSSFPLYIHGHTRRSVDILQESCWLVERFCDCKVNSRDFCRKWKLFLHHVFSLLFVILVPILESMGQSTLVSYRH